MPDQPEQLPTYTFTVKIQPTGFKQGDVVHHAEFLKIVVDLETPAFTGTHAQLYPYAEARAAMGEAIHEMLNKALQAERDRPDGGAPPGRG
jgi:hypothetical protein